MTQHEQNAPLDQQATIQRLERLSHDQAHLRQAALQLAGSLLQDCGEDVMQLLIGELDEDIVQEEGPLYLASEELFQAIAKEVARLGRELSEAGPRPCRNSKEGTHD